MAGGEAMSYRNHFLKEHIPTVENELACIRDLCERIKRNTRDLKVEESDRFIKDLENSWRTILDLHDIKKSQENKKAEEAGRWF